MYVAFLPFNCLHNFVPDGLPRAQLAPLLRYQAPWRTTSSEIEDRK